MALQLAETLDSNGVIAPNAYFKIGSITFRRNAFEITVRVYYNQQSRDTDKEPLKYETYQCPVSDTDSINKFIKGISVESPDVIARGYYYLKQKVDKFSNSLDV